MDGVMLETLQDLCIQYKPIYISDICKPRAPGEGCAAAITDTLHTRYGPVRHGSSHGSTSNYRYGLLHTAVASSLSRVGDR